jgi:hypothetical protein
LSSKAAFGLVAKSFGHLLLFRLFDLLARKLH